MWRSITDSARRASAAFLGGALVTAVSGMASCEAAPRGAEPPAPARSGTPGDPPPVAAPVGRLGMPIGTLVRVEGVRVEAGKAGNQTLRVDTIDGRAITPPVEIWVENRELPSATRLKLQGYESGEWIGVPQSVLDATGEPPHQAAWQFRFVFIAAPAR